MHRIYHSFLTGVMDLLIGNCVYQLLTIEYQSTLPTAYIYLLFMALRINSDFFANNVACVMGIQGFCRFLFLLLSEISVWNGQQWASEILLLFDVWYLKLNVMVKIIIIITTPPPKPPPLLPWLHTPPYFYSKCFFTGLVGPCFPP